MKTSRFNFFFTRRCSVSILLCMMMIKHTLKILHNIFEVSMIIIFYHHVWLHIICQGIEKMGEKQFSPSFLKLNILHGSFEPMGWSSRPEVFCRKGVLRNFAKFTGKHLCQSFFFNKVSGLRPATLLKKENLAQVFSCEFCKISKNTYFNRTSPVSASKMGWIKHFRAERKNPCIVSLLEGTICFVCKQHFPKIIIFTPRTHVRVCISVSEMLVFQKVVLNKSYIKKLKWTSFASLWEINNICYRCKLFF